MMERFMGWLRRILGVSGIKRLQNDFIWSKAAQEETQCARIQRKILRWFGPVEKMDDNRLPHRALHCCIEGKRSRGRQKKDVMGNLNRGLGQEESQESELQRNWQETEQDGGLLCKPIVLSANGRARERTGFAQGLSSSRLYI